MTTGRDLGKTKLNTASHLTLYQVPLLLDNVAEAVARVDTIALTVEPLHLMANDCNFNCQEGSLEVRFQTCTKLQVLQAKIVSSLNEIRGDLLIERDPAGEKLDTSNAMIRTTGFSQCDGMFSPHVTLNWFKIGSAIDTSSLQLLQAEICSFSGYFSQIAIFVLGPHGTCPQLLHAAKLSGDAKDSDF